MYRNLFEIYEICMGVCPAMHYVMLRGTELKPNMGVRGRSPSFESILFKATPSKVKGHPENEIKKKYTNEYSQITQYSL